MKRKQSEAQLENLKKGEKTRFNGESAARAQKLSQEAKKRYRPLKELAREALDEETVKKIYATLIEAAIAGDVRSWESIRDTAGEKPKEQVALEADNEIKVNITVVDK